MRSGQPAVGGLDRRLRYLGTQSAVAASAVISRRSRRHEGQPWPDVSTPSPSHRTRCDDLPVFERTLANGLKALVLPRRRAPIVVCDLYYPVGSFDEPPGLTGLAHFVEHMLFKGTERFPKGQIDRLVLVAAGQSNAETGEDSTHYWFAFPSDRWELALAIEADRMRGAQFDAARGRGRAAGDRRGAGPRAQFSPGPARPDPSGRHLPPSSLSQPDPGLARRHRADRRRRPEERFTRRTTGPTARCWSSSATSSPKRPSTGSPATSPACRRASAPLPDGRRSSSRARPAAAISRSPSRSRRRAASSAGAPCRAAIATRRPSTCSPTSSAAAAGRGSGSRWSRPTSRRPGSKPRTARPSGPASSSSSSKPRPAPTRAAIEQRIAAELLALWPRRAVRRRAGAIAAPARGGLALGTGRPGEPGRRPRQRRALGRLAGLAGRASRRARRRGRATSAASSRNYLVEDNLTVGWSLPRPRGRQLWPRRSPPELTPDRAVPAGAAPTRRFHGAVARRSPPRQPRRRRRRSPWRCRRGSRGSPISSPRRIVLDNGLRLVFERRPGHRRRRARALRRRRTPARGQAGPGLPDRPVARGRDDDPDRPGARRGDRGRRGLARGRLDRGLAPGLLRGPGPGAGAARPT